MSNLHWTWVTQGQYRDEGVAQAKYAVRLLHARRVALVYLASAQGEACLRGLQRALPCLGAALVLRQPYEDVASNFPAIVARLKATRPDIVVLSGLPLPLARFMGAATAAGYRPRLGFLAGYAIGSPSWVGLIGAAAMGMHFTSYADISTRSRQVLPYLRAIGGDPRRFDAYEWYGFVNATMLVQALAKAGADPTRASLRYALDHDFIHYSSGSGPVLSFTPKHRLGITQFAAFQAIPRGFVQVSPYLNPNL